MAANAWKEYLTFTKKERLGVVLLLALTGMIYAIPEFLPDGRPMQFIYSVDSAQVVSAEKSFQRYDQDKEEEETGSILHPSPSQLENAPSSLFEFDPNTLEERGWKQLGVSERTIRTILNYRQKGGQFRHPEDLRKIYGMNKTVCETLIPYVRIRGNTPKVRGEVFLRREHRETAATGDDTAHINSGIKKYSGRVKAININTADSASWEQLPGIGGKLASRIILFRERLGGFYSVQQVAETFGIADSVFNIILPFLNYSETTLIQININELQVAELARHPYIRWNLANAIVNYRKQHGSFRDINELKLITAFTPALFDRLQPYLVLK